MSEKKEKIESKGAYSYDLHEAIRDTRRAFANNNLDRVGSCLEALYDTCAPEIRKAIEKEWVDIDNEYREPLGRIQNADLEFREGESGWAVNRYTGEETNTFFINRHVHAEPSIKKRLAEDFRRRWLAKIMKKIYRKRFQACIDCLDRHGELRKWREVEYGKA